VVKQHRVRLVEGRNATTECLRSVWLVVSINGGETRNPLQNADALETCLGPSAGQPRVCNLLLSNSDR
jgi:hypothetical protein